MAAEQITLKAAGSELILTIQSCGKVPVGKYPEISFIGTDHAGKAWDYRMPQSSADRQLGRQNLTYTSIVGLLVRFSRDPNPTDASKPYHGLTLLGDADGVDEPAYTKPAMTSGSSGPPEDDTPHPASRSQGQPVAARTPPADDLYLSLTRDTLANILPLYVKAGILPSAEAIGSMVATRFIAASPKRY